MVRDGGTPSTGDAHCTYPDRAERASHRAGIRPFRLTAADVGLDHHAMRLPDNTPGRGLYPGTTDAGPLGPHRRHLLFASRTRDMVVQRRGGPNRADRPISRHGRSLTAERPGRHKRRPSLLGSRSRQSPQARTQPGFTKLRASRRPRPTRPQLPLRSCRRREEQPERRCPDGDKPEAENTAGSWRFALRTARQRAIHGNWARSRWPGGVAGWERQGGWLAVSSGIVSYVGGRRRRCPRGARGAAGR